MRKRLWKIQIFGGEARSPNKAPIRAASNIKSGGVGAGWTIEANWADKDDVGSLLRLPT
jgi:hypothetical protein